MNYSKMKKADLVDMLEQNNKKEKLLWKEYWVKLYRNENDYEWIYGNVFQIIITLLKKITLRKAV